MKKIISFFIFSIALISCQMAETELKPNEYLKIDRQMLKFDDKSSYGYIGIESNAAWTLECNDTWLDFSVFSGTGNDLVKVTVDANVSTVAREATVVVTAEGGLSKQVHLTQSQLNFTITAIF